MRYQRPRHPRFNIVGLAVAVAATAFPVFGGSLQAQPAEAPPPPKIEIASCSVRSNLGSGKVQDCTDKVARECGGKPYCELGIGNDLTDGRDIDPEAGTFGKSVIVRYTCSDNQVRQRGPYAQNDHATLILECFLG